MPTTNNGIYYPAASQSPRVWEDMQAQAESIDVLFNSSFGQGWTTYGPAFITTGGVSTWSTKTGYWRYMAPKLVYVVIYMSSSATGTGTGACEIDLPRPPDRSTRQMIPGAVEGIDSAGALAQGYILTFTSGSGVRADRLRIADAGGAVSNLSGNRITSAANLIFQGMYREA